MRLRLRSVRIHAVKDSVTPSARLAEINPISVYNEIINQEIKAYRANRHIVARVPPAEELRTLVENSKFGTLRTFAPRGPVKGHPLQDVVAYATDAEGHIMCALSNQSRYQNCEPQMTLTVDLKNGC